MMMIIIIINSIINAATHFPIWYRRPSITAFPNPHEMRRWSKRKKMYHGQLLDFLVRFGGGNDPLKWQNRAIGGFWENARFIRSNGRKTTFEWPTVVSEVIFPRFWGVVCIEKCFRNFEILIRSAVSEMSRFARFCAKTCKTRHLRNGTSDHN